MADGTDGVPAWLVWLAGILASAAGSAWIGVQWLLGRRDRQRKAREGLDAKRQDRTAKAEREHDEWVIGQSRGLVADLRGQVEQLVGRIDDIQREHIDCRVALATMTERVQRLEAENARQGAEILQLRQEVARLKGGSP